MKQKLWTDKPARVEKTFPDDWLHLKKKK